MAAKLHRRARWKAYLAAGLFVTSMAALVPAMAEDDGEMKWTPNATGPRDLEGVWRPAGMGAPATTKPITLKAGQDSDPNKPPPEIGQLQVGQDGAAGGAAGAPPGGAAGGPPGGGAGGPPAGGAPPGGAPPGGGPGGGQPSVGLDAPSNLQCAPLSRLTGAAGGESDLWIQGDKVILNIAEDDHDVARKIYMNVKHPAKLDPQPNGNSVGHWEGNTLVVDSIGYAKTDGTASDQHVVERITKQGNKLVDEMDVTTGGKTSHSQVSFDWRSDLHVYEDICEEGYDRYQVIDGQVQNPNIPPSHAN